MPKSRSLITASALLGTLIASPVLAAPWLLTFDSQYRGPLEAIAEISEGDDGLSVTIPGFDVTFACEDQTCVGTTGGGNVVTLEIAADAVSGSVSAGALEGPISGVPAPQPADQPVRDYEALADTIIQHLHTHVYDPAKLESDEFNAFEAAFRARAASTYNDIGFTSAMRQEWSAAEPFSHVSLERSANRVDDMLNYLDTMRIGQEVARLTWQGDVAVLTVDTMMGLDTIEQIDAAYAEIASNGARALIIDVRENGGGAFAIKPLVEHIIDTPQDVGIFLSRRWSENNAGDPSASDISSVTPWEGWSVRAFWADVLEEGIVRVQFTPVANNFDGPVYVLVSERTASASEIAVDALMASETVTVIGEQTDGAVLSQTMFELPGGYLLSLPIADYVSAAAGRLEGIGITPDVTVSADQAMDTALELIN